MDDEVNNTSPNEKCEPENGSTPRPVYRKLRGYAFDPSLSVHLDTAVINEITYKVEWEEKPRYGSEGLLPGPIGKYIEVVDYDPASGSFYAPVDLNDPHILAQDGLPPSEGNPQFHQQMVYAVTMTTIRNFERALGRPALWAPRLRIDGGIRYEFVERLRVYPHALREANAYYSPEKKALLFGYFPASFESPERYLPGGIVFSCLSHDIIAHETTHALLDGMHSRFTEANHRDTYAFHEAFADIVALFQHFSFPEVLRHQIARTRGNLATHNLLGELAQQFGEAIGNYGALRDAIGEVDKITGKWKPHDPKPEDYENTTEPHARGAILVAAVFDAFLAIYKSRVADLLRIASSGTGILQEGELHPDLVNRLASEASKSAQHVLNVCIRALDYCPPIDINFGDYLRAIITADVDLVPDDDRGYRIAFIEAFRRRGIYPRDVRTLSTESLRWPLVSGSQQFFEPLAERLRSTANDFTYFKSRREVFDTTEKIGGELNDWIVSEGHQALKKFGKIAGITFEFNLPGLRGSTGKANAANMETGLEESASGKNAVKKGVPKFQIHSLRPARRVGPDGTALNQLIISLIQSRDIKDKTHPGEKSSTFKFRGGSTLVLDLDTMKLRYAITKDIADEARLERHIQFRRGMIDGSPRATYFRHLRNAAEPFALLHRSVDSEVP
ncbi:MAG: hypothetical protein DMF69_15480 [Acidobacteria bacterium]|nr:MAG: hypothetical protein DMF69_15480 [Acidobacteriota bacterium]